METNKVPEKIYLNPLLTEDGESIVRRCTFERQRDSQIEYTRTDAFVEKAETYLKEQFAKDVSVLAGGVVNINFDAAISNFVKYMKGE